MWVRTSNCSPKSLFLTAYRNNEPHCSILGFGPRGQPWLFWWWTLPMTAEKHKTLNTWMVLINHTQQVHYLYLSLHFHNALPSPAAKLKMNCSWKSLSPEMKLSLIGDTCVWLWGDSLKWSWCVNSVPSHVTLMQLPYTYTSFRCGWHHQMSGHQQYDKPEDFFSGDGRKPWRISFLSVQWTHFSKTALNLSFFGIMKRCECLVVH